MSLHGNLFSYFRSSQVFAHTGCPEMQVQTTSAMSSGELWLCFSP